MAGTRELDLLLRNADAIRLLGPWYGQQWAAVLRAFARGIGQPGPARVRSIQAELRQRLAALHPRKSKFLGRWIEEWVDRAFWLGVTRGTQDITDSRKRAEQDGAAVVPVVQLDEAEGQQHADVIKDKLEAALAAIALQAEAYVMMALARVRQLQVSNVTMRSGTTGGIIRSVEGRAMVDDLRQIVTDGMERATVRRLLERGVPSDLVRLLDRLNLAVVINMGKVAMTPGTAAERAGKVAVMDAWNEGILLASEENAVLYVEIYHTTEGDKICPFCAGVEYHVFFAGQGNDPLGFPRLADLPSRPPFHPNCDHHLRPWAFFDASSDEYERRLAESLSIPAEYFGPGAVERVNQAGKPKEGAA